MAEKISVAGGVPTEPRGAIVFGQSAEEYFADPGIGRTDLMTCLASPAKYKAGVEAKARKKEWARGEEAADEE